MLTLRNTIIRTLIVVGSLLIITGIVIIALMTSTSDNPGIVNVDMDNSKPQAVEFNNFDLVPGSSCEYEIKFNGSRFKQYTVALEFVEKENKSLKDYLRVKIISGDKEIYDNLLANAFSDIPLALSVDFDKGLNTDLKLVYYLPIEVGNEAKNADADFELLFKAESEENN